MKNRRNYYRILHVQPEAPADVIRASYRTLMQRLGKHPDRGGDHDEAALINEAYAVLGDPHRRADYDRKLRVILGLHTRGSAAPRAAPEKRAGRDRESAPPRPACSFCGAPCAVPGPAPDSTCARCGSPLYPAGHHRDDGSARRALDRVPRALPVALWCARSPLTRHAGVTEDLSLNGVRIAAAATLATGERVRIACDLCSALAVVKSIRRDDARGLFVYGMEFLTLHLHARPGGLVSVRA